MSDTLFSLVKEASLAFHDDRTPISTWGHLQGEVIEFRDEIETDSAGEDGIKGEAMDIINCTIDIIIQRYPETTEEELLELMRKKLNKWKEKYGQPHS